MLQESLSVHLWVGRKNTVLCSSSKGRLLLAGTEFDQLYLYCDICYTKKRLFEERKIIFVVRVCGPEVLEEVRSSDSRLRGVFSAGVMFLPKWGGSPPKLEAEWHL